MSDLRVFTGGGQRDVDVSAEMCEAIKAVVYAYSGRVPLATAVGVLEIAKREILDAND